MLGKEEESEDEQTSVQDVANDQPDSSKKRRINKQTEEERYVLCLHLILEVSALNSSSLMYNSFKNGEDRFEDL